MCPYNALLLALCYLGSNLGSGYFIRIIGYQKIGNGEREGGWRISGVTDINGKNTGTCGRQVDESYSLPQFLQKLFSSVNFSLKFCTYVYSTFLIPSDKVDLPRSDFSRTTFFRTV